MMQTADMRNRDNLALFGRFDFPFNWRVSIQRQVRPHMMIIVEVVGEDAPQVALVEHDYMIEALATDGTD